MLKPLKLNKSRYWNNVLLSSMYLCMCEFLYALIKPAYLIILRCEKINTLAKFILYSEKKLKLTFFIVQMDDWMVSGLLSVIIMFMTIFNESINTINKDNGMNFNKLNCVCQVGLSRNSSQTRTLNK